MAKANLKVAQTPSALPRKFRNLFSVLTLLAIVTTSVYPFHSTQLNEQERQEWEQLFQRFKEPRAAKLLIGPLVGGIHGGGLKVSEEMTNLVILVLNRGSGRQLAINTREFKNRIASFLSSDNDDNATCAAIMLGITGDLSFAPQIATLLDKPDPPDDANGNFSRISAAFALSLMGAKDYVPRVALMLKSKHAHDRAGAATALGQFHAREYAKDVARLLSDEFVKADAAKALAIMGASEYADQIARLLKDNDETNRIAALIALGIMRATKYEQQVARHLKEGDDFVRLCAAVALVLMDADRYAKTIIPKVERLYRENSLLLEQEFHPFVVDELQQIDRRFRSSFERMKKGSTLQRSGRIPGAARLWLSKPDSDVTGNVTLLTANCGSLDRL